MNTKLTVTAFRTDLFKLGDDLFEFVKNEIFKNELQNSLEGKILVITSKIVSLAEHRVVARNTINKLDLVKKEADYFLGEMAYGCYLTITKGLFIASAGIDESNTEGDYYILFPEKPFESLDFLRKKLKEYFKLQNFGMIMSDSHTTPLRRGVTGISLTHVGFKGVKNKIGSRDLYDRPLKMTQIAVADALAASAVFCMGEADESCPLALLEGVVDFCDNVDPKECYMNPEDDMYAPLYLK